MTEAFMRGVVFAMPVVGFAAAIVVGGLLLILLVALFYGFFS